MTEGVYAILGRYYFLNNINVWLWGLYGNDGTKGWEVFPTASGLPEYGGRVQAPLFTGEVAFSYHHRIAEADLSDFGNAFVFGNTFDGARVREDRFGLDGKWDVGVGVWFEGALVRRDIDVPDLRYQRLFTAGMDYTFDVGNGLTVLGEHFLFETSSGVTDSGDGGMFTGLSLSYPLGVIDSLMAILYYDWENDEWYRHINWTRKFDDWSLHVIGFWNPDIDNLHTNMEEQTLFTGKGVQVMVVFNY